MEVQLKETERIDDLQLKGLKLIQDTNGFCFGKIGRASCRERV